MPIISTIGRRSLKIRAVLACIYMVLIVGSVSMIYPLLLEIGAAFIEKGRFTGAWIWGILSNRTFLGQLVTSLVLACTVTVLCNLHSVELARAYCDRLVGMAAGRIVFDGVPSTLTERASRELYGMDRDRAPNEAEHGFAGRVAGVVPAT